MNGTSWDERMEEFISVLCYKSSAKVSSVTSTKTTPTNKIFLNMSLLSTLVILFFLEHDEDKIDDDIFTQIKDRAKNIISKEIIDVEIDRLIKNFQPIKKLLLEYLVIQKDKRATHIENLDEKCNLYFEDLLKNEKIIHLIPFTVTFAIVHLTVLRESSKIKTSDLGVNAIISRYQNHFTDSFHQFFTWRMNKITTKTLISNDINSTSLFTFQANGEVKDEISNKIVTYFAKSSNDQIFTKVFDLVKLRMLNEAKAEFMKMFLHVFSLVNFFPNHNISWPLNVGSFWVGPYGIDTFPDGRHCNFDDNSKLFYNISDDESGVITKIELRHGRIIDRFQAFYEGGRAGKEIGTSQYGTGYTISNLDEFSKYIIAVNLNFGWGLLCAIEFIFNDGETTGCLGSKHGTTIQIGPFGKHNEFRLSGIIGGGGKDKLCDMGENAAHIAFRFQHVDL